MNPPFDETRIDRLLACREYAPSDLLGRFDDGEQTRLVVFNPAAESIEVVDGPALQATRWPGLFAWSGSRTAVARDYRLRWYDGSGGAHVERDAFGFRVEISSHDRHLFNEGRLHRAYDVLGALPLTIDGCPGVRFAVWAPNAERVSVVGDFNGWDTHVNTLTRDPASGLWSATVALRPGRHVYAFIVDDSIWMRDPRMPQSRDADFGRPGSVLLVGQP